MRRAATYIFNCAAATPSSVGGGGCRRAPSDGTHPMTNESSNPRTTHRGWTRQTADLPDTVRGEVEQTSESEPDGPIHPHQLSNDLTTETLRGRTPAQQRAAESGIGATSRHVMMVVGGLVLVLVAAGLIGTAALLGERGYLVAIGAVVAVVGAIVMAAPILLAAGTKVAQDEAVRDVKTSDPDRSSAGAARDRKTPPIVVTERDAATRTR